MHPSIEVAAALLGVLAWSALEGWAGPVTAMFGWWLLLLGALDVEHHWLPDRLTLPLIPAGLLVAWLGIGPGMQDRLIGAAAGFLVLWGIAAGYRALRGREGLGDGDPKLLAGIGAWLGWQSLPFVLLGAGLLGLIAVALAIARGRQVAATDRLPLGTLLALAGWPLWLLAVSGAGP